MTLDEFQHILEGARTAHPRWFKLPPDAFPGDDQANDAQSELGVELPREYIDFLRTYGGGDFAFVVVYSLDPSSDVNLLQKNAVPWLSRKDFVAVSDNGAGDYYGFLVEDGHAKPEVVLLDHEDGEFRDTGHADWFEFLVDKGLRQ